MSFNLVGIIIDFHISFRFVVFLISICAAAVQWNSFSLHLYFNWMLIFIHSFHFIRIINMVFNSWSKWINCFANIEWTRWRDNIWWFNRITSSMDSTERAYNTWLPSIRWIDGKYNVISMLFDCTYLCNVQ